MAVDYSKQYRPSQLEPFFPNELIKMGVSMLVTLAVIVTLVLLIPEHVEEPADPRNTPHIKPEWYFLAVYQCLKLMPQTVLGISGEFLCVVGQGAVFMALLTVPFWYRKHHRQAPAFTTAVTLGLAGFLVLTVWGIWPEDHEGRLLGVGVLIEEHALFVGAIGAALVGFCVAMAWEARDIRRNWRA